MNGVDTTLNHGVHTGEKMSPLGNGKPSAATSLHGSGGSPDPWPPETGGATTIPSHSLSLRDAEAPAPRDDPRQILERGIRRAF
ncbi:MAG: hypothetical protein LBF49_00745, partial [Puniceicoccales bacterium]|nr:hypothetical protein [Puniceicoccales bacterium]